MRLSGQPANFTRSAMVETRGLERRQEARTYDSSMVRREARSHAGNLELRPEEREARDLISWVCSLNTGGRTDKLYLGSISEVLALFITPIYYKAAAIMGSRPLKPSFMSAENPSSPERSDTLCNCRHRQCARLSLIRE
ncbi:hypothetical protein BDW22DRAFT_852902 [Trametopsis cervina]|nr:hypothetical protein BDW22DRAFT_852902 [Trametopsis cervina]